MAIPEFNEDGDLPVGIHPATLADFLARFGRANRARVIVGRRLQRIVAAALSTGRLRRLVVFGSFVTAKEEPNDVDVFMIMDDEFDAANVPETAWPLFRHAEADREFGASVFWISASGALGGEQSALEDWQVKRDRGRRDIVEITGDS
jgi:hypothetical protein